VIEGFVCRRDQSIEVAGELIFELNPPEAAGQTLRSLATITEGVKWQTTEISRF